MASGCNYSQVLGMGSHYLLVSSGGWDGQSQLLGGSAYQTTVVVNQIPTCVQVCRNCIKTKPLCRGQS